MLPSESQWAFVEKFGNAERGAGGQEVSERMFTCQSENYIPRAMIDRVGAKLVAAMVSVGLKRVRALVTRRRQHQS
jgi:hypothetical protein